MRLMVLSLTVFGACKQGALSLSPPELAWGEVDFQGEPLDCTADDGGCDAMVVTLTNSGQGDLNLRLPYGYDGDHLCVEGFDADAPLELGLLAPGSSYNLKISVCGYLAGERDSEVSGALQIETDGEPSQTTWPWSFTPVRDFGEDTSI